MKYGRTSYLVDVCVWSYHLNLPLCSPPFWILTVVCYKLLTPPDGSVSTPIRVHNTTNSAVNTIVDIRAKMCCPRMWPLSPRRLKSPFSDQAVLRLLSEWRSSAQAVPTIVDWQGCLTSDSSWVSCHQSAIVLTPVKGKTRMSLIKRLRCFMVGCYNEHSSRHLLRTSEPLKTQRINVTFVLKGMCRSRST